MDPRKSHGKTRRQFSSLTCTTPSQSSTPTSFHTTNAGSSAMLCVFEDNEAVIKMIIKGRSPTMRHVSRTHRVALDWLFDRINLDTKIQIKYIDTKNQLADMLTKGNFTRDEWNHLLSLFNIVLHSSSNQLKKSKENVQGNLQHDTPSRKQTKNQFKTPTQCNDLELCNVDYVSSNVKVFSLWCDALNF